MLGTKPEIKIALVMDDYKLNNREYWWKLALDSQPTIEKLYKFDREEVIPGVNKNTTTLVRHFKLKEPNGTAKTDSNSQT